MSIALVHGTVADRQTQREVGGKERARMGERDGQADRQTDGQTEGERERESDLLPLTEPMLI